MNTPPAIHPLAAFLQSKYDAFTNTIHAIEPEELLPLLQGNEDAELLARIFLSREATLREQAVAGAEAHIEPSSPPPAGDISPPPSPTIEDTKSNDYVIQAFRHASHLRDDTSLPLGKALKGTEQADTVDRMFRKVRNQVKDLSTLRTFLRQSALTMGEHGLHGLEKILLVDTLDPALMHQRYSAYYSTYDETKQEQKRAWISQEQTILYSYLKKSFQWHAVLHSKMRDLKHGDKPIPEDTIGLAALIMVRLTFEDITLDTIIRAYLQLITFFSQATEHDTFDAWYQRYERSKRDHLATYGRITENILDLCNIYLALQIIGKRTPDLARVLRLKKLEWKATRMTDILTNAEKIKMDLTQTARQWQLEMTTTSEKRTPQNRQSHRFQRAHVVMQAMELPIPAPTPAHTSHTKQTLSLQEAPCSYCQQPGHTRANCRIRAKDELTKEKLGPLIVTATKIQSALDKSMPQILANSAANNSIHPQTQELLGYLQKIWAKDSYNIWLGGRSLLDYLEKQKPSRPGPRLHSGPASRSPASQQPGPTQPRGHPPNSRSSTPTPQQRPHHPQHRQQGKQSRQQQRSTSHNPRTHTISVARAPSTPQASTPRVTFPKTASNFISFYSFVPRLPIPATDLTRFRARGILTGHHKGKTPDPLTCQITQTINCNSVPDTPSNPWQIVPYKTQKPPSYFIPTYTQTVDQEQHADLITRDTRRRELIYKNREGKHNFTQGAKRRQTRKHGQKPKSRSDIAHMRHLSSDLARQRSNIYNIRVGTISHIDSPPPTTFHFDEHFTNPRRWPLAKSRFSRPPIASVQRPRIHLSSQQPEITEQDQYEIMLAQLLDTDPYQETLNSPWSEQDNFEQMLTKLLEKPQELDPSAMTDDELNAAHNIFCATLPQFIPKPLPAQTQTKEMDPHNMSDEDLDIAHETFCTTLRPPTPPIFNLGNQDLSTTHLQGICNMLQFPDANANTRHTLHKCDQCQAWHTSDFTCYKHNRRVRYQTKLMEGSMTLDEYNEAIRSVNTEIPTGGHYPFCLDDPTNDKVTLTVDDYRHYMGKQYTTGNLSHIALTNPTVTADCLFSAVVIAQRVSTLDLPDLHRFLITSIGGRSPPLELYQTGCTLHSDALYLRRATVRHLKYLRETKLNSTINDLLECTSDSEFDTYIHFLQDPFTPASILEVATLADMLKIPIEVLRENEEKPQSLTSFGAYLPNNPLMETLKPPILLVLDDGHFSPLITPDSCIWPDKSPSPSHIPLNTSNFQATRHRLASRAELMAHTHRGAMTISPEMPRTTWLRGPSLPADTLSPLKPKESLRESLLQEFTRLHDMKERMMHCRKYNFSEESLEEAGLEGAYKTLDELKAIYKPIPPSREDKDIKQERADNDSDSHKSGGVCVSPIPCEDPTPHSGGANEDLPLDTSTTSTIPLPQQQPTFGIDWRKQSCKPKTCTDHREIKHEQEAQTTQPSPTSQHGNQTSDTIYHSFPTPYLNSHVTPDTKEEQPPDWFQSNSDPQSPLSTMDNDILLAYASLPQPTTWRIHIHNLLPADALHFCLQIEHLEDTLIQSLHRHIQATDTYVSVREQQHLSDIKECLRQITISLERTPLVSDLILTGRFLSIQIAFILFNDITSRQPRFTIRTPLSACMNCQLVTSVNPPISLIRYILEDSDPHLLPAGYNLGRSWLDPDQHIRFALQYDPSTNSRKHLLPLPPRQKPGSYLQRSKMLPSANILSHRDTFSKSPHGPLKKARQYLMTFDREQPDRARWIGEDQLSYATLQAYNLTLPDDERYHPEASIQTVWKSAFTSAFTPVAPASKQAQSTPRRKLDMEHVKFTSATVQLLLTPRRWAKLIKAHRFREAIISIWHNWPRATFLLKKKFNKTNLSHIRLYKRIKSQLKEGNPPRTPSALITSPPAARLTRRTSHICLMMTRSRHQTTLPPYQHPLSTVSRTDVTSMTGLTATEASKVIASYHLSDKQFIPILKDSASNVNLIPEDFISFVGVSSQRRSRTSTLKGIGQQQTQGTCPMLFSLHTTDGLTHIYKDPVALIIPSHTGPRCPLLSEVLAEKKGYSWKSNQWKCTLTTPCQKDIELQRDHTTGFWYLQAIKSTQGTKTEHARKDQSPPTHEELSAPPSTYATRDHAPLRIPRPRYTSLPQSVEEIIQSTHENLGHVARSRLIDLANQDAGYGLEHLKGLPRDAPSFCEGCIRGKTRAQPAPKLTVRRLTHPKWGVMSLDLTGHIEQKSLERHHYGVVAVHAGSLDDNNNIIDDGGTGFSIFRGLSLRSDILTCIQGMITVIGAPPKRLHTDNAKELCSQTAEAFYRAHGINHTTIPPYEHYSLGKAERLWGTLKSLAKCMLLHSGVPPFCWELALKHANLIKNMTMPPPNKAAPTQWQAYYGEKPDFSIAWAFGCLAYVHISAEQKGALKVPQFGPTAISGLYMGMSTLNGENKHLVLSDNNTLLACTRANIHINYRIYPMRPAATIPASIAATALLTYRHEPKHLLDPHEELTPLSYLHLLCTHKKAQRPPARPTLAFPTTLADKIKGDIDRATCRRSPRTISKQDNATPDTRQDTATSTKPSKKEPLPKNWYEATIIGHQGDKETLRYLIRWDGYSSEHDNWVHPKDISAPAIAEYNEKLVNKLTPPTRQSVSPLATRILPKDIINGDYANIDAFKESADKRQERPVTDPFDITILPQAADYHEIIPYKDSTYTQLTPTDQTTPDTKSSAARSYLGRQTRRALSPQSPPLTATVTEFDSVTDTFTLTHDDSDVEYIDRETLNQYLINDTTTKEEDTHTTLADCYNTAKQEAATIFDDEPKGEKQAANHPEAKAILESKQKEIDSFYKMQVMKEVRISTLPQGTTLLPSHIVYKRKYKIDLDTKQNIFDKWKARLVIGGNRQPEHDNPFAPTPSWPTIRLVLSYTADPTWKTVSYDLASAFCRTPLKGRAIYVRPPPGIVPPGHCWQLLYSIYGLIEACADYSALRNEVILTFSHEHNGQTVRFEQSEADPCLFIMRDHHGQPILILVAYIDDLILGYKIEYLKGALINHIDRVWEVSSPEPLNRYLGIHFRREDDGGWFFDANAYILKACEKYKRYKILPHSTPLPTGYVVDPDGIKPEETTQEQRKHFQSIIGTLLYSCVTVRWDISFALSTLSQYLKDPNEEVIKMAYRILGYLLKTAHFGIRYKLPSRKEEQHILYSSCDAGFAGCLQTRRSQEGHVIFYNGGPISWSSRRQAFVTLSTCEAELASLVQTAKQMLFLNRILSSLSKPQHRMIIYEDNTAAIKLSNQQTPGARSRTKHLDIRFRWVQEKIAAGLLRPLHIPTNYNIADLLTKALSPEVFNRLIQLATEPRSNPALIHNGTGDSDADSITPGDEQAP